MRTKVLLAMVIISLFAVSADACGGGRCGGGRHRRLFNRHHNECGCGHESSCCGTCGCDPCCCEPSCCAEIDIPHEHYCDDGGCINNAVYYGDRQDMYAQVRRPRGQPRGNWPWNRDEDQNDANDNANNEEELPEPAPNPVPLPVPDDTLPIPAPTPVPDPEPIPDQPLPTPGPTPSIPEDRAELNSYVAKQLGGYSRANHSKNGATLDIYQARGKQRIVWETAEAADWMGAIGKAFYLKGLAGSSNAGVVLVCNDPAHPAPEPPLEPTPQPEPQPDQPPTPEPIPAPDTEPVPVPDNPPAPEPGEVPVIMLRACGGQDLVDAQMACEASGCWLVVVRRYGGQVNRVFYNPAN